MKIEVQLLLQLRHPEIPAGREFSPKAGTVKETKKNEILLKQFYGASLVAWKSRELWISLTGNQMNKVKTQTGTVRLSKCGCSRCPTENELDNLIWFYKTGTSSKVVHVFSERLSM